MGDPTKSPPPQQQPTLTPPSGQLPLSEDDWTEDAMETLIDAWSRRHLELNGGHLRWEDWAEVSNTVNARKGCKTRRTMSQCRSKFGSLRREYETERAKIEQSNGTLKSTWPFFSRLEILFRSIYDKNQVTIATPSPVAVPLPTGKPMPSTVYSSRMVMPQKLPSPSTDFMNYSIAAAAPMDEDEDRANTVKKEEVEEGGGGGGMKMLAEAIESFAEVYQKMESMKMTQMIELEKKRMEFAKDLASQTMQFFTDTLVSLEKMKRDDDDGGDGES